jgi:cation:H+ antiporter
MIVPGLIILLFLFTLLLIRATDMVIVSLKRLSRETHTKVFVLSAVLLAIATSFPELFVGITSALEGAPHLSFGNVMGANIANISLVAGIAALVVGKITIHGEFIKKEVGVALVASVIPILLILDGTLSRVDGLILLAIYGAYSTSFFKTRFIQIAEQYRKDGYIHRFLTNFTHPPQLDVHKAREYARLFIGLALLLFSADIIVRVAMEIAVISRVPIFLVGLILLSIGTTLPELAFSIRSLEDREPSMFFGNVLGSIIANSTLVLGVAATIYPITVMAPREVIIAGIAFIVTFSSFWFFIRSKLALERWEAGVLLLLYLGFVVAEFF